MGVTPCETRPLPPPPPPPLPAPAPAPAMMYAYPGANCIGGKVCIGGSYCFQGSCNCPTGYSVSSYTCTQTVFVEPAPAPPPPPPQPIAPPPAFFAPAPAPAPIFVPAPAPAPAPAPPPFPIQYVAQIALPAPAPAPAPLPPPPAPVHIFAPGPAPGPAPAPAPMPFPVFATAAAFPPPPHPVAGVTYYVGELAAPAPVFAAPVPRPAPVFAAVQPAPIFEPVPGPVPHFPRHPEPFYNIIGSAFPSLAIGAPPLPAPAPIFEPFIEPGFNGFNVPFGPPGPGPIAPHRPVPVAQFSIPAPLGQPACAPNYVLVGTVCQPRALVAAYPKPFIAQSTFVELGASCQLHNQCVAGAFCQQGVCACRPAFVPFGSVCIQRRKQINF